MSFITKIRDFNNSEEAKILNTPPNEYSRKFLTWVVIYKKSNEKELTNLTKRLCLLNNHPLWFTLGKIKIIALHSLFFCTIGFSISYYIGKSFSVFSLSYVSGLTKVLAITLLASIILKLCCGSESPFENENSMKTEIIRLKVLQKKLEDKEKEVSGFLGVTKS